MTGTPSAYQPSQEPEALWGTDLSDEQRGWMPTTGTEVWTQVLPWKSETTTASVDGKPHQVIELTNGADPSWDWRTVALWVRALGTGWRVHLRHPGRIDLLCPTSHPGYLPQERATLEMPSQATLDYLRSERLP